MGEKGLIMGPVKDWGKKSVVISGGSQFTLEDVTKKGWEKLGKMKEVGGALTHAAEVGKKMFEEDNNALHLKWMEMEGGEVFRVGDAEIKENGTVLVQAFA